MNIELKLKGNLTRIDKHLCIVPTLAGSTMDQMVTK
jgi:hypothetical protein